MKEVALLSRWLLNAFIVYATILSPLPEAAAQSDNSRKALRADAMLLVGASIAPIGYTAYCNKFVARDERLLEAARQWNVRHDAVQRRIVAVFEATGGVTKTEREFFDRLGAKLVREELNAADDKVEFCRQASIAIEQGALDLSRREDTAKAAANIMRVALP